MDKEESPKNYDSIAETLIDSVKKTFNKQPSPRRSLIVYKSIYSNFVRQKQYQAKKMF